MLHTDNPARIETPGTFAFAPGVPGRYTLGRDHVYRALQEVLHDTNGQPAVDIETEGLGLAALHIKCVSVSSLDHAVILDPRDPVQERIVQDTFSVCTLLYLHNSPFDMVSLYLNGLCALSDVYKVWDTLPVARLAEPDEIVPKSLAQASARYLGTDGSDVLVSTFKRLGLNKKDGFRQFDLNRPIYAQGAASDPLTTLRLVGPVRDAAIRRMTEGLPARYRALTLTTAEAEQMVEDVQTLNRMFLWRTCKGYRVDFEFLDNYRAENGRAVAEAEKTLRDNGISPGNGNSLMARLEELDAVPVNHPRTPKTGALSTTAAHLEKVPHDLARMFVQHKKIQKVGTDYLEKVATLADVNGRVHPSTNILAAATGRASMGDPPFHQFPPPARGIVLADEGDALSSIDFAQIEPVTMAYVARDTKVLDAHESGVSLYIALGELAGMLPGGMTKPQIEADPLLGKRYKQLKETLLAQMYGQGLALLTTKLGLDPGSIEQTWRGDWAYTYPEAKMLRESVFRAMPETAKLINRLKGYGNEYRRVITVDGRVLTVPMSKYNGEWKVAAHKAVNYFCQGSAYGVLAYALLAVHDAGLGEAVYLSMHDELVVSSGAAHDIRKLMESPPPRLVSMAKRDVVLRTDLADLGERWSG